jgi:hypothetical protein
MNGQPHSLIPEAVGDDRLWRTNPVWCIDRLLACWGQDDLSCVHAPTRLRAILRCLAGQGVRVPPRALARWAAEGLIDPAEVGSDQPQPGVVGLVVDRPSGIAWVAPLEARSSRSWSVAPNLPFRPATVLQDTLVRMILALGLPQGGAIPERLAFEVEDRLGRYSDGPSMHVAGLLAVLAGANQGPEVLRRACAVVQPEGDHLVPVGSIHQKLEAFCREIGHGTLLVRPPDCPEASAYDNRFENIWEVSTFQQLARHAEQAELLQAFLENVPLGRTDQAVAQERLRVLVDDEHRYREALDLACRLEQCQCLPEVGAQPLRDLHRTTVNLYRHLGYYVEAEELAVAEARRARMTSFTSHDEQAQADVIHAAALFDPHRFEEMEQILEPWVPRLAGDPLLVAPETRVWLFNTLARALVILGRGNWQELFEHSLDILQHRDPFDMPRTCNYLAHGLLRHGPLHEAKAVLVRAEQCPGMSNFSRWMLRFHRAEHARRCGRCWTDREMEDSPHQTRRLGHPFGYYFQATARQPGRTSDDAARRFRQARDFFLRDAPASERSNILPFLADCMLLAEAAWSGDPTLWRQAREALDGHLQARQGCRLADYYRGECLALGSSPNRGTAETFLCRVPFF